MLSLKTSIFILLLMLLSQKGNAQISIDSLKNSNDNSKISLKDVIGNWYTMDTLPSKIVFVTEGESYVSIHGIYHGVSNYTFHTNADSVYVNGTAPNWPPYDCTLRLINSDTLEIMYYQYYSTTTHNVLYKRK